MRGEQREGPQESELRPATAVADKLLVLAWIAILVPAAGYLYTLSMEATDPIAAERFAALEQMQS